MKSKVNRIFIVDGIEYRIKENQDVSNLPKHVQDKLVSLGLVDVEKSQLERLGGGRNNGNSN